MDLVEELTLIHRRCKELIINRDSDTLIPYMESFVQLNEDDVPKLNKLKIVLVITKNVPEFFPEITEARAKVKTEYERIYEILIGGKAI